MILFVLGTHLDVSEALSKLGLKTSFHIIGGKRGLDDYAMEHYKRGDPIVLAVGGSKWELKFAQQTIQHAKENGLDLVVESLYWQALFKFVNDIDLLYINGRFFKPAGVVV
ncbi:MAG: hypothetical protein J7K48_03675 [Thermococcus sp.]|nr:hypothetical protein [Thermococcus sp.]